MIGAFHQPDAVLIDIDCLATLPARELAAGLAEVVKYGAIRDAAFFAWLEANVDRLLAREPAALEEAIAVSCRIKAEIVAADERETGERALLNFGHTFGHAIEAGAGLRQLAARRGRRRRHGDRGAAVAAARRDRRRRRRRVSSTCSRARGPAGRRAAAAARALDRADGAATRRSPTARSGSCCSRRWAGR